MRIDLEQRRREDARWRILRILDAARPQGANETLIWGVLSDLRLPLSQNDVRRELDYLAALGLLTLEVGADDVWFARLTAAGVDVVEYTAPAPPGVGRPRA